MAVFWNKVDLPTLAEKKINEVNEACDNTIYSGIDVVLSDGSQHFSLTLKDQTDIDSMFNSVTLGATEYPYHSDGNQCKILSANDIILLYAASKAHVTYHTTYCNELHTWINRETDSEELSKIYYGIDLPEDLKTHMSGMLEAANNQVQNIISRLPAIMQFMSGDDTQ